MKNVREIAIKITKKNKMVKDDIKDAKRILDYCNNIYYNTGDESPLTDKEYDDLFNKVSKYIKVTSLTETTSKRLVSVSHEYSELVGTLTKSNAVYKKDITDENQLSLEEWFNEVQSKLSVKSLDILVTLKYDGNSVCLITKDGKVVSALTRGKDGQGADVTNLFTHLKFPLKGEYGIKTEIMITDEDFNALVESGCDYKKPRSVVAGILSKTDGVAYKEYLTVVPLRIQNKKGITREEELKLLDKLKCKIKFPKYEMKGNIKSLLKQLNDLYKKLSHERESLNFSIDGLVIEIVDNSIREKLGRDKDKNKYDIALKFPPLTAISKVKDIEFYSSTSATGRITPVLVFEDLIFDGATCNHVSLSNYKRFKELNLAKGDEVTIDYRNDCLSYCTNVVSKSGNKPIKFITKCPMCGEKLFINKTRTFVSCKNEQCPGIVKGKIQNYLEKINVKGIKENTVKDLVESGLVKTIPDLYKLTSKKIMTLDGYKEKSANNIIKVINDKKDLYDWEILGSLQIDLVSRSRTKELCKLYTIDELYSMNLSELKNIDGFADKIILSLSKGLKANKKIITALRKILNIKDYKEVMNQNKSAVQYKIVFTGFRDKELQEKLELKGHKVTSSVSSATNILVVKDKTSTSSKITKAKDLGIKIMDVEEIKSLI